MAHQLAGAEAIARAIRRSDYFRRSEPVADAEAGHKEWMHFCVHGPGVDILINFSLVDDVRPEASPEGEFARLTVLIREGAWDGDVERFGRRDSTVHGGRIAASFGDNRLEFKDGDYHITIAMRRRNVSMQLRMRPIAMPSLTNNVQLDSGPPISWLVVPRLLAFGVVSVEGRTYILKGSPAYHDHNWGEFSWGRDFSWEWGFGLPQSTDIPWSVTFSRLSNRHRTQIFTQGLLLWKGETLHRIMTARDLDVAYVGRLRSRPLLKLPRVMALISPGGVADVPASVEISADGDGDELRCRFHANDVAQIIIPNDRDLGVTIINEVSGTVTVEGVVRGENVEMEGRATFEFLRQ